MKGNALSKVYLKYINANLHIKESIVDWKYKKHTPTKYIISCNHPINRQVTPNVNLYCFVRDNILQRYTICWCKISRPQNGLALKDDKYQSEHHHPPTRHHLHDDHILWASSECQAKLVTYMTVISTMVLHSTECYMLKFAVCSNGMLNSNIMLNSFQHETDIMQCVSCTCSNSVQCSWIFW